MPHLPVLTDTKQIEPQTKCTVRQLETILYRTQKERRGEDPVCTA